MRLILISLILSLFHLAKAQKNNFQFEMGLSFRLSSKASGFSSGFYFQHEQKDGLFFTIDLQYNYTQGRGNFPKDIQEQQSYLIRDFNNPNPWNSFQWDKESFAPIRLATKPNKYLDFSFGVGLNYLLLNKNKQKVYVGASVLLDYHDEKEIVQFIKGDLEEILSRTTYENIYLPIQQYDTYLNVGLLLRGLYTYQINEKLSTGLHTRLYLFPDGKDYFMSFSPFLGFKF